MDLQDSLHLSKRLVWLGNAGCCGFCTVHTGTTAEADDRLAVMIQIHVKGFVHIDGCWIGNGFVVDMVRDAASLQCLLQSFCKAKASDTCICDDEYIVIVSFFQNFRDPFDTSYDLRIAVRKQWKGEFKDVLENPAVSFF